MGEGAKGIDTSGYDDRGRPVYTSRQLDGYLFEFTSSFDNADRPIGTTYPNGKTLTQVLDRAGRITAIPGYISVTYTDRGKVDVINFGNGVTTSHTYDALSRLASLTTVLPKSTPPLQSYAYQFDRVSNLLKIDAPLPANDDPSAASTYTYDAYYRLNTAALDQGRQAAELISYEYDEIDNILSKVSDKKEKSKAHAGAYSYNGPSGPHAVDRVGNITYAYDATGNTTLSGQHTNEWDHEGRLTQTTHGPRVLTQSVYNDDRQRVMRTASAGHAFYIRNDFEIRDGVASIYVTFNGAKVAKIESPINVDDLLQDDHEPALAMYSGDTTAANAKAMHDGAETMSDVRAALMASGNRMLVGGAEKVTYLHQNHLGTTAVSTDEAGNLLQRTEHFPFGQVRFAGHQYLEDYGFTGEEHDFGTGLNYHSARYLDSLVGRWTSADPLFSNLGEDTLSRPFETANRYIYVKNNPLNAVDRLGLAESSEHLALMRTDFNARDALSYKKIDCSALVAMLLNAAYKTNSFSTEKDKTSVWKSSGHTQGGGADNLYNYVLSGKSPLGAVETHSNVTLSSFELQAGDLVFWDYNSDNVGDKAMNHVGVMLSPTELANSRSVGPTIDNPSKAWVQNQTRNNVIVTILRPIPATETE